MPLAPTSQADLLAAVREVGARVIALREAGLSQREKSPGDVVTNADLEASARLMAEVHRLWPDDRIVSEEAAEGIAGRGGDRIWYIDPIDGTSDFVSGRDGFTIMVGLAIAGHPAFGAVYQPTTGDMYYTMNNRAYRERPGARREILAVSTVAQASDARLVASRSRRTADVDAVKGELAVQHEFNIGSIGLKLCLIACGEFDLYVNPRPRCRLWDTCAPEAILRGAGGELSTLAPATLSYAAPELALREGLVASNGHIHAEVVAKLRPLFARK